MNEWINLTEYNWTLWIAGLFALLELFRWVWSLGEWLVSKFGVETKNMKAQRENRERLTGAENDIKEIKKTAEKNVATFLEHERLMREGCVAIKEEVIQEIGKLHDKIDEHGERLETIDKEGKARDSSLFRDRLLSGLRYFSQNKDEHGNVHISATDFENLSKMFDEYEKAGGNGLIKHLKETEFDKFIVDTDRHF